MFAPFLVGFLVVASGFAGAVLGLSWHLRRDETPGALPSDLGRALELTPEGPHEAVGERDGIRVHVRWTSVRRSSGGHARTVRVMRYWATLDPPLELGLEIAPRGSTRTDALDGFVVGLGTSGDLDVANPALDRVLAFGAIDRAQTLATLSDPALEKVLLRAARQAPLAVTDTQVATGHDGWAESSDSLRDGIDVVHRVAVALQEARARAGDALWKA